MPDLIAVHIPVIVYAIGFGGFVLMPLGVAAVKCWRPGP